MLYGWNGCERNDAPAVEESRRPVAIRRPLFAKICPAYSLALLWDHTKIARFMMSSARSCIEILESRIAPAATGVTTYYLSGKDLKVTDGDGNPATVDTVSAASAHANFAILLGPGDKLLFDPDGTAAKDASTTLMATVANGHALIFVTDFSDGNGGHADQVFEQNEITGVAVSDGFRGEFHNDINGPIVTALTSQNTLANSAGGNIQLPLASISSLSVDGQVAGKILAGNAIANVAITGPHPGSVTDDPRSVTDIIATGTAAVTNFSNGLSLSFNHNTTKFSISLASPQLPGAAGGSISNVHLAGGAKSIIAGDGADNAKGPGGAGGSISNVTVDSNFATPVSLQSGSGGDSTGSFAGGVGGAISGVSVIQTVDATSALTVTAGHGGASGGTASAGAGGGVFSSSFITEVSMSGGVSIQGGAGGTATVSGYGGAGGPVNGNTIHFLGANANIHDFSIQGGDGGASLAGSGGVGGAVSMDHLFSQAIIGTAAGSQASAITAGAGGSGGGAAGAGGNGGNLNNDVFVFAGDVQSALPINLHAGAGGVSAGASAAGAGGGVLNSSITTEGSVPSVFSISGGIGGKAGGTGVGGAGGPVSNDSINLLTAAATIGALSITGGAGGDSTGGHGGAGGAVSLDHIFNQAKIGAPAVSNSYVVAGGEGGKGVKAGGNGGSLLNTAIALAGGVQGSSAIDLHAGAGGDLEAGSGTHAGNGGSVTSVSISQTAFLGEGLNLSAGDGGSAQPASRGNGGNGGAITSLTFNGIGSDPAGSSVGLVITSGAGGASAQSGKGGAGGDFTNSSVTETGQVNAFTLKAGSGNVASGSGAGGIGGSLNTLNVTVASVLAGVQITAGAGGNSMGHAGAAGGSITAVNFENTGMVSKGILFHAGGGGTGSASTFSPAPGGGHGNGGGGGTKSAGGGAGGIVSHLTVSNVGGATNQPDLAHPGGISVHAIDVEAGAGGLSSSAGNGGGVGGNIVRLALQSLGSLQDAYVVAGPGGMGGLLTGPGGAGGSILNSAISEYTTATDFQVASGTGGSSNTGKGGAGGAVTGFYFGGINAQLDLHSGGGGSAGSKAAAGAGGTISGVSGAVGIGYIQAGSGGNNLSSIGAGGAGGSIQNVNITAVGQFVRMLRAGDGGLGKTGGAGGSVGGINVAGDIGDFAQNFDVVDENGMGGIVAGERGAGGGSTANGSIANVAAVRIATMIAGAPTASAVTYANEVFRITNISAAVIGADVNGNGVFDFTSVDNHLNFTPGTKDTAIDGFVIVQDTVHLSLPVTATTFTNPTP